MVIKDYLSKLSWGQAAVGIMAIVCFSSLANNLWLTRVNGETKRATEEIKQLSERNKNLNEQQVGLSKGIEETIGILREQQSPKTQAANDGRTADAIRHLDCSNQLTSQRVLDVQQKADGKASVNIISQECLDFFIANPPSPN